MIKEIRRILQSGQCLSDFSDKCKNDGACGKCEDEALEKLIAEHDAQIKTDVIDEFLKKAKECQQNNNVCPYMYSDISCIECISKELNEQK